MCVCVCVSFRPQVVCGFPGSRPVCVAKSSVTVLLLLSSTIRMSTGPPSICAHVFTDQ